jgi:hypothetical protein
MALTYKSSVPLAGIAVPLFSLFLSVAFELTLQLSALISLSLSLGISLVLPTIAIGISICISLILQFQLAIGFTLPDFSLNLTLALNIELTLVLGFTVILKGLINAIASVNLCAYGWFGPAADFGTYVNNEIGAGWPDGTKSTDNIQAFLFVATTSGAYKPDQIAALSTIAAPPPPPPPTQNPPPAGAYPPPQAYEAGLAGVFISAPPPGGTQATGTVTVDNSVSTGIGAITSVNIVDHGSGYTSAPMVMITDSVNIVHATVSSPIVVTLPNPLTIPVSSGVGVTIAGVLGSSVILNAVVAPPVNPPPVPVIPPPAPPIQMPPITVVVITVESTVGLKTVCIPPPSPATEYGMENLNGTYYCNILSPTTAELWADADFTIPSGGSGTYIPNSAKFSANICGLKNAKVLTPTTVALYDIPPPMQPPFSVPSVGYGTYTDGTVTGGGTGAAATCTMGGGATNALQSFINGLPWPTEEGLAGGVVQFSVMLSVVFDLMKLLLGNLEARAALLAGASIGVQFTPPSISASIQFLAQLSANLSANLKVKLPSLSISAAAALSAQINAIASLTGQIGFFLGMSKAGLGLELEIWEYQGPGSAFGQAIASGPGAAGWHDGTGVHVPVVAGVFGLTTQASQSAFATFFAGA